jgi:hypothetical protein
MGRSLWPALIALTLLGACVVAGAHTMNISAASLLWGSLRSAMSSPMTYVVLLPLGWAAILGAALLGRVKGTRHQLRAWLIQLRTLTTIHADGMSADHWASLRDGMRVPQALLARWVAWSERLLPQGRWMRSGSPHPLIDDGQLLGSIERHVLGVRFRASLLHQLPGLMTGLGMLGTFGGIALGLGQLGATPSGAAGVVDGIGHVVIGLASAFWTSIFGLLTALAFSLLNDHAESHLLAEASDTQEALDALFPPASIEQLLQDQHTTLRDAEAAQREVLRLHQLQLQHLQRIAAAQEAQHHPAAADPDALQQTLAQILHLQARQLDVLERAHADGSPWPTLIDLHQQQLSTLLSMREDAEESRSQLQTIASDLADSLARQLQDSISTHLGPQLERLLEVVEQQVVQAAQVSSDASKHFTAEMVSQLSGAVRDSFDGMNLTIDTFASRFSSTTAEIGDLLTQIQVAVDAQRQVVTLSAEAAQALHEQTEHMIQRWSAREAELLTGYKDASEGFVSAFSRGADMGEAIVALSRSLHDRADDCDRILAASERVSQESTAAAQALCGTIAQTASHLDGVSLAMRSVTDHTQGWVLSTTEAVDRFGASLSDALRDSLTTYDRSLSQAVRSLSGAINELEELTFTLAEHGGASNPHSPTHAAGLSPTAPAANGAGRPSVVAMSR